MREIAVQPIEISRVIWEKCFKEEICIKIPLVGKKCLAAKGCVRIILLDNSYFLELELLGARKRFNLGQGCFPFSVGIGSLKVCANPNFDGNKLTGLEINILLCIGGNIDKVKLEKCWVVYKGKVKFIYLAELDFSAVSESDPSRLQISMQDANMIGRVESYEFLEMLRDTEASVMYIEAADVDQSLDTENNHAASRSCFNEDFDHASFEALIQR